MNKYGFCDAWESEEELVCYVFFVFCICMAVTTLMGPILRSAILWSNLETGEGRGEIWGRSTGVVKGQEIKVCKLNEFNLFSLSKERLRHDITTVYKYLHGENTFDN